MGGQGRHGRPTDRGGTVQGWRREATHGGHPTRAEALRPLPGDGRTRPRKTPRGPAATPHVPRRAEGTARAARRPGTTGAEDEGGGAHAAPPTPPHTHTHPTLDTPSPQGRRGTGGRRPRTRRHTEGWRGTQRQRPRAGGGGGKARRGHGGEDRLKGGGHGGAPPPPSNRHATPPSSGRPPPVPPPRPRHGDARAPPGASFPFSPHTLPARFHSLSSLATSGPAPHRPARAARVKTSRADGARPTGRPPPPRSLSLMILPQVHLRKPCYDFYFL